MNNGSTRIETIHLQKNFGEKVAVDDVSFAVQSGEIFGFLRTQWRWQNHDHQNDRRAITTHFWRSQSKRI